MRIAVNTRLLLPGRLDGIGWFTAETLRRIVSQHPEHQFFFFFGRKPAPEFLFADNVSPVVLFPQARHPLLWMLFFEWSTRRALKRLKIDLYLSPDGFMPLHTAVPTLNVIHDLNFEHAAGNLKASHQWYMHRYCPRFAQRATRLATVSEYSKKDIVATYHLNASKVDVVYDGAHADYRPHSEEEKQVIRQRYTAGCPYIIFVSTIIKRKNLANLLLAFDSVKDLFPDNLKLLVVGSRVWWQDELKAAYDGMRHKDDVLFPGRVESTDLAALLSAAEMLVYPSFFEGFGIPILEAMYAETPVVASSTTSMPEVGGDAALYVDPHSVQSIAEAIISLRDTSLRDTMIARGRQQRTRYSWDRTAALLWESMKKTVEG